MAGVRDKTVKDLPAGKLTVLRKGDFEPGLYAHSLRGEAGWLLDCVVQKLWSLAHGRENGP